MSPRSGRRAGGEIPEAAEAEDDTAPDVTSVADLLHMLERVAGEGRKWPRNAAGPEAGRVTTRPTVGSKMHDGRVGK